MRSGHRAIGAVAAVILLALTAVALPAPVDAKKGDRDWAQIRHVVIVMMENHAFDNYFGTYCPSLSAVCPNTTDGIPPGTCEPLNVSNLSQGCVRPFNFTAKNLTTVDLNHWAEATLPSWNHGLMNGFYQGEGRSLTTFGTYNGTLIPTYWDMAEEFGLADHMFSDALSYSLPNHWYLVGAQEPKVLEPIRKALTSQNVSQHSEYLNQSNGTKTVEQLLANHSNVSWAYYDFGLQSYSAAINASQYPLVVGKVGAFNDWNPLAAQAQSYTPGESPHFQATTAFFGAIRNRTLPNISWVIPDAGASDHPPSNLTIGQNFVASVVNAVGGSKYWNSTAIFVTWDEYGGFFDHVAPPVVDSVGDSFRVPLLVVSPWTPAGFVGHTNYSFDSLLAFVEWRWGLGCIGPRDCSANLPTAFFDLKLHRPALSFLPWASAHYPYAAPAAGTPNFVQYPVAGDPPDAAPSFSDD